MVTIWAAFETMSLLTRTDGDADSDAADRSDASHSRHS
eukprot:gene30759-64513_t